jgi:hypothetical protein
MEVRENQMGLKENGIYQLLSYTDYVNLLVHNTDAITRKTRILIDDSKKVGSEINI